MQVRYQAAPRPDRVGIIAEIGFDLLRRLRHPATANANGAKS